MKTFYDIITEKINENNETWSDVINVSIFGDDLRKITENNLNDIFKHEIAFMIWTKQNVYFPIKKSGKYEIIILNVRGKRGLEFVNS